MSHKTTTVLLLLTVCVLALDRIAKWFSYHQWSAEPLIIWKNIRLTFLLNKGIAFSLPFTGIIALTITIVILLLLIIWEVRLLQKKSWGRALMLLLIILGAGSNMLDRFLYGGVVDYLQVLPNSVFNLADVMVVAGVVLLIVPRKKVEKVVG